MYCIDKFYIMKHNGNLSSKLLDANGYNYSSYKLAL